MSKDVQQVLRQNPQNRSVYELVKVLKEITYPIRFLPECFPHFYVKLAS